MNRVLEIYKLTDEMINILGQLEDDVIERDTAIQQITQTLERREKIMKELSPPYTDDEAEMGRQVVDLNITLTEKMNGLYENIKSDLKRIKQKKEYNRFYMNPHGNIKTTDGMYLDSKQ